MKSIATTILRDLIPNAPVFTTVAAAAVAGTTVQITASRLKHMAAAGLVVRVVRGLWAVPSHPEFSPYAVVPYLLPSDTSPADQTVASWSEAIDLGDDLDIHRTPRSGRRFDLLTLPVSVGGYISAISALHLHGMLSQIPREIHVVVRVQRRPVVSPVGSYRFHQIRPDFFTGAAPGDQQSRFYLATPAKALVDTLYLSARRGRQFAHLPELELPYLESIRAGARNNRGRSPVTQLAQFRSDVDAWIKRIAARRLQSAVRQRWDALEPMLPGE